MVKKRLLSVTLAGLMTVSVVLTGCSSTESQGVTTIDVVQYKQEAVDIFNQFEEEFNATHTDVKVNIESPNDATTVLKTRFIREDYPDIIGIGGDVSYSDFIDANILQDVTDYPGLSNIKESYIQTLENLEYVPTEGTFGVPYAANAAGILYNKDMFDENGWKVPTTWNELMSLCKEIKSAGVQPFYFGFKDSWTTLAPWNALAVELAPADTCAQVNAGKTTFTKEYRDAAEKMKELLPYGEEGPIAYGYNDACTAFARGESAMYTIGSYAIPQILSVNPDMNIDSFVMPGGDTEDVNVLNSGVDLQFCITKGCKNKAAAYEVLDFLLDHDNLQAYLDAQNSVPCSKGDFTLSSNLDSMKPYIDADKTADYQDHHYPAEMSVDGILQTLIIDGDTDAFLAKFDKDWQRYNRDTIRKLQEYNAAHSGEDTQS